MPKNSGLAQAVLAALKVLMKNGTYMAILTKWGVQAGAIPAAAGEDQRRDELGTRLQIGETTAPR